MSPINVQALEIFAQDVLDRAHPPGTQLPTVVSVLLSHEDSAELATLAFVGDALIDIDELAFKLLDEPEAFGGVIADLAEEADISAHAAAEPISDLVGEWLPSSAFLIGLALCHVIRRLRLRLGTFELTVETREILGPKFAAWLERYLARKGEKLIEIVAAANEAPNNVDDKAEDDEAKSNEQ